LSEFHELNGWGLLRFSGEDAESFLQAQLSCDVTVTAGGRSTYGSYCTPQGRVLATFVLWRAGADYFMQIPLVLCASLHKRLSMYILRSKVKAADASGEYALAGVSGDDALRIVSSVFGNAPASAHDTMQFERAIVIRLAPDRFAIVTPLAHKATVFAALSAASVEADANSWARLDVHAGIPWVTPATQEAFVPQMLNLDLIGAVSFSKGCYPGQEIVARAHYRGQVKQRMYRAHIAGDVCEGDRLYSTDMGDQASGTVVNVVPADAGGCDVIAVIQRSSVDAGQVHWKSLDGPLLQFMPLPYSVPQSVE
jgi:tRNA-modifying protein YgfZ